MAKWSSLGTLGAIISVWSQSQPLDWAGILPPPRTSSQSDIIPFQAGNSSACANESLVYLPGTPVRVNSLVIFLVLVLDPFLCLHLFQELVKVQPVLPYDCPIAEGNSLPYSQWGEGSSSFFVWPRQMEKPGLDNYIVLLGHGDIANLSFYCNSFP